MFIPLLIPMPEPISTNDMYSNVRQRRILSPAYRAWVNSTVVWVNSQKKDMDNRDMFPLGRGYEFYVYMIRWNNHVKDISNYIKSAEDLMVRCGIILDDRHIEGVHSKWIPKTDWVALMECKRYPEFIKAFIGIQKSVSTSILTEYNITQESQPMALLPRDT